MTEIGSLKELVIQGGLELLDRDGLKLTFKAINYAKVFHHLEAHYGVRVTRASVHERIWTSQDHFCREVLTHAVGRLPPGHVSQASLSAGAPVHDPDDFARYVGGAFYAEALHSAAFGQFQSAKALAFRIDDPVANEALQQLFTEQASGALSHGRQWLAALLARLRLRPRMELGLTEAEVGDVFQILVAALFAGGHLNQHAGSFDITTPAQFMSIPPTADQPWCVASIAFKAILDFLFESDPESATMPQLAPLMDLDGGSSPTEHQLGKPTPGQLASSRRSRQELKHLVLAAGVELLLQGDLGVKPELLGYKAVFAHIKDTKGVVVNGSSVHKRLWASNEDFHLEVLTAALRRTSQPVVTMLDPTPPALAGDGAVHRQQAVMDVIRLIGAAMTQLSESPQTQRLLQIKAALHSRPESEAVSTLRAAVKQADQERIDRNHEPLRAKILDLGFQVRPELGLTEDQALQLICLLGLTTNSGMMFDQLAGIEVVNRRFPLCRLDEDGQTDDWTSVGIAMLAYFNLIYHQSEPT